MGEVAGESLEEQIAKRDAACAVTESQGKIAHDCHFWLNDGQASSFLRPGPPEVPFRQPTTKVWVTIERMHKINVERMGQIVCELFFETLDHVEAKLVINSMRGHLLLEFAKGRIEYPFLCTIAMPLDHQQSMSVGHHEKERAQSIPIRASLFQCFIQIRFTC